MPTAQTLKGQLAEVKGVDSALTGKAMTPNRLMSGQ